LNVERFAPELVVAVVAAVGLLLEAVAPRRRARHRVPLSSRVSDIANVAFFMVWSGLVLAAAAWVVREGLVPWLRSHHLPLPPQPLARAPWAVQALGFLVVQDLFNYATHRLLHRVPAFWLFHRVHHGADDDHFGVLITWRFHWVEKILYTAMQLLPLLFFAIQPAVAFGVSVLTTALGAWAHTDTIGPPSWLARLLVTPRFHRWHHAHEDAVATLQSPTGAVNFGAVLSIWDRVLGTAWLRDDEPARLGTRGADDIVDNALGHQLWPLLRRHR
jgi:sterol desaturase/sphingolipid hydroxylase (fatty acid hydroxylase superfamily)